MRNLHSRKTASVWCILILLGMLAACGDAENSVDSEDTAAADSAAESTTMTADTAADAEKSVSAESDTINGDETGAASVKANPIRRTDDWVDWNAGYNDPKVKFTDIVEGLISQDVYVGKDGWMFYVDSIEDYLGSNLYSDTMLKRIANQTQARADWCTEHGMQFYFMIAPNKNTIYPEMMMSSMQEGEQKRIDQVYDYLRANTTVKVIDVRDSLFAAKENNPDEILYYPLDTHWNNHGGYYAYQAVMDVIAEDFPGISRVTRDDYQIDYFDSYYKDCAYYLGYYDTLESTGPVYTKLDGKTGYVAYHDGSGEFGQFAHAFVDPETGFRESAYYTEFANSYASDAGQPSVYVVRDSFYIALSGFMSDTFSSVTSCWTTDFPNDDIENHDPDIVIFECVEAKMGDIFGQKTLRN